MVSRDSQAIACPLSGRNSTYRPVQISGTGSDRDSRGELKIKQEYATRMEFHKADIEGEYERVHAQHPEDPYESSLTLGLHEVIRAHFLIADFFLTEQRELGRDRPEGYQAS
jgi:hypothetical protein